MKLKSLLFGSAAVMAAGTGVQAADLPTVEPVEYVRICDVFGTGFFYIPGTDTCLKVGGYVRAESHYVDGDDEDIEDFFDVDEEDFNHWTTRVRGQINLDARTQTELGLIRTYVALEGTRGPEDEGDYGEDFGLASAFVQVSNDWGTYTAGKFGSFFDFFGSKRYGTRLSLEDGTTDSNLFAWTFAGGNGFSFTIAAEDPLSTGRRRDGDEAYRGQEFPDGVANIRLDQGWGSAQVMGAVRSVESEDGDPDEIGFAVGAGVSLGIPGGWNIVAQGGYSEGMIAYISNDPGGVGDIDTGDLNESWAVRGGISGPLFSPNFAVAADGNYIHAEEDDGGTEYDFFTVALQGKWTPVSGLSVGPEIAYSEFDFDSGGDDSDVWGVMWRLQRNF